MIYDQHCNIVRDPYHILIAELYTSSVETTSYLGPSLVCTAYIRDMKELRDRLNDPRIHDSSHPQIGGWGNGYVTINKLHPWYNEDLETKLDFSGGATYNQRNCDPYQEIDSYTAGFDTFHYWNTLDNSPKEFVINQTLQAFNTLLKAYIESDFFVDYEVKYY